MPLGHYSILMWWRGVLYVSPLTYWGDNLWRMLPTNPSALPEEIRLDLWPSFTSPRIKAAVCSYGPRPHESNFIDHLESYRHPLNTKCRWKATGCGEMSTSCRDWRWDLQCSTPGCDGTAATAAHKYGDFTSNKILYNQRGLKHTLIFS